MAGFEVPGATGWRRIGVVCRGSGGGTGGVPPPPAFRSGFVVRAPKSLEPTAGAKTQEADLTIPEETMDRLWTRMMVIVPALALGSAFLAAGPAAAAYDDGFTVYTTDRCGAVDFVDHGAGAPGGGDNDDYAVVHDYCGDGHGVKAWAWLDGTLIGSKYDGGGLAGDPVVWDPFKDYGNVLAGDAVGLKVCLVDGTGDPTPAKCASDTHTSVDG
jgi:hypothetical protein